MNFWWSFSGLIRINSRESLSLKSCFFFKHIYWSGLCWVDGGVCASFGEWVALKRSLMVRGRGA